MDFIKVTPLGGLDENGRDCYAVEINDDLFVLDCGVSLPDKTIPGVDCLLPNPEYLVAKRSKLRAYIITHGHDENMAALKYFYDFAEAPIYCTESTRSIITGQANTIYGIKTNFKFHIVNPSDRVEIAGREFVFFQTCHNAADSFGVAIDTDKGYIVYTGDFIVDYSLDNPNFIFDIKTLSSLKKPTLLLMAESKTAHVEGYCAPKHRVAPLIEDIFSSPNKRIFTCCFWQNIFRIYEIFKLARDHHRKVYLYNEYTKNILSILRASDPYLYNDSDIIKDEDFLRVRTQDVVVLLLGYGEELYEELIALCEGKNLDKRITITENDYFVNCAIATPTMETIATRTVDMIYRTGCDVRWIKGKNVTSMHACQDDLKFFLSVLRPKYYIPTRGSFVNLMSNARLALSVGVGLSYNTVFVMDNGMQLTIDEMGKSKLIPSSVTGINVAPLLVDGSGITDLGSKVVQERQRLSNDGVVIIAATVSLKEQRIYSGPDCQMRGFVYAKEAEPLLKTISNIFVEEVESTLNNGLTDFSQTRDIIKDRAKKFIKRENGREPLVIPIIDIIESK